MSVLYIKDFSRTPGARYRHLGKASGEEFRDDILIPAIEKDSNLIVNLDGVRGYGSSFLDEAFAGLVRLKKFDISVILGLVERIESNNSEWKNEIKTYVNEAIAAEKKGG